MILLSIAANILIGWCLLCGVYVNGRWLWRTWQARRQQPADRIT